jgi:hypothetical protein
MSKTSWTKEEVIALHEAVRIYGNQWNKIKEIYGPTGNKKLVNRVIGARIAVKARSIAKQLYTDPGAPKEICKLFHCVLDPKKALDKPPPPIHEIKQWTLEQDEALLKGYSKHSNKYRLIVKDYPILASQNIGMRIRDRIVSLQKKTVQEKTNDKQFFINCPLCNRFISEKELIQTGLYCYCGVTISNMSKATKKYSTVVYIISKKGNTLTDPVEYVGATTNLYNRLQSWIENLDITVRITFRLSEKRAIGIFNPLRNNNVFDLNSKELHWREHDITTLNSAGIIHGIPIEIDTDYCYLEQSISCECSVPCQIRAILNQFKGLPKYYPLDYSLVSRKCGNNSIDYSIGLPCEYSERFLVQCSQRNQDVKKSTKKAYAKDAATLFNLKLFRISPDEILMLLTKSYANSTLCRMLSCINIIIMNMTISERKQILGENYINIRNTFIQMSRDIRTHIRKSKDEHQKTKKEEFLWVDYETLMQNISDYYKKTPQVGTREYENYVLIRLHTIQASIRNDYRTVKLFNYNEDYDNYIDWDTKTFVFNDIKNSKFVGKIQTPIDSEILEDIKNIRNLRKSQGSNLLLHSKIQRIIATNTYTTRLQNILKKVTGKPIGSQMLRKITVSYFRRNEPTTKENREFTNKMHHSENVSRTIYRKV